MNTLRISFAIGLWIALCATVYAEDQNKVDPEPLTKTEQVSNSLEGFIGEAMSAGLLSGPNEKANDEVAAGSKKRTTICQGEYPLDFTEYESVRLYSDLAVYRSAENADSEDVEGAKLIKAYLSLGLYAEAMAVQDKNDDTLEEQAYTAVAKLLDGYRKADEVVFAKLANCHSEGELWLSISQLIAGDGAGANMLGRHVDDFRKLPVQLRVNVAAKVLPTLRYNHEILLGKKLLATFEQEEITGSSRLNLQAIFLKANAASGNGALEAYDFLSRISPSMNELLANAEGDTFMGNAQQAVVAEEAYKVLRRSTDAHEIAAALQFALEGVKHESDYGEFLKLMDMPSLATDVFQRELKEQLASRLMSDLKADEHLTRLAVVDTLANHPGIIAGHSAEAEITKIATDFLKNNGQSGLAAEVAHLEDPIGDNVVLSAQLAYREGDTDALYKIAQENMSQVEVVYLGALAAVEKSDAAMFNQMEQYLPKDAERLLVLAEEDALVGGWLLTEKSYEMVQSLADEDQLKRLNQVLSLKKLSEVSKGEIFSIDPAGVKNKLLSSKESLERLKQEGS